MNLKARAAIRFVPALPLMAALLFLPAGSLKFWQGWVFVILFLGNGLLFTVYFYRHDPRLLERRLQSKEKLSEQRLFRKLWIPLWIIVLALPGLDYRFGWSNNFIGAVPLWLTLVSQALMFCASFLIFQVLRANSFASSIIQVEAGQKVISSGPYRIVRHPMYSALLVLILATPLALGSFIALPASALLVPVLIFRLIHEERTLRQELAGYSEYCLRTRFRVVPIVW
jgi:protein-S-isoprenylcysteine O-methyltransferase Ste14